MFENFKKEIEKIIINLASNTILSSAEGIKDKDTELEEVSQVHEPLPIEPKRQNFMKKLNDLIDELENNHD
jgi:hypothetical protein